MTTVVTGASGFLGSVLVRMLLDAGEEVRAVDRRWGPALAGLDVEMVEADVLDPPALVAALEGATKVFHLAAVISIEGDPHGRVWAVNVEGVRNVARAALEAGVRRLVHCSSVHAFDLERSPLITEKSPPAVAEHLPVYDRSKAAGEAALRSVVAEGLDAVIINPTGILGPYDVEPSRMGGVLLSLFQGGMPVLVDGGFDWVDVRDVAAGAIAAVEHGRTGENYLLAGHHVTMPQIATLAGAVAGVPRRPLTLPLGIARAAATMDRLLPGDLARWFTPDALHALRFSPPVSAEKATAELGYRVRPFETTIEDTYRWFRDHGDLEARTPRGSER